MLGPIIAGPLGHAGELNRRGRRSCSVRPASLCRVSVVRMPRAAATSDVFVVAQLARRPPECPAAIFSIGRNSPMTPVDSTSACFGLRADGRGGQAGHLAGRPVRPRSPVQALALPELTATTRMSVAGRARAVERHRRGEHQVLRVDARGRAPGGRRRPASGRACSGLRLMPQ